jgi:sterol desaturase/sphingolipid hydroxylase (fatty acid hydroxylase superfamily)
MYFVAGCVVGHLSDAASLWWMLLIRHATGVNAEGFAAMQPAWIQFLEILLIADFCAYWYHRCIHSIASLWRLHKIHHSSQSMDWLANARLHPLDKVLGDCCQFVPIFCLGFGKGPLLAYTIFRGFQGFLNHSNTRVNLGPLRWIIASPQFLIGITRMTPSHTARISRRTWSFSTGCSARFTFRPTAACLTPMARAK